MLALACLVFAFAYPYLPAVGGDSVEQRYINIYLDNSPSMTSGELQSSKIAEVRSKAAEFIKALPSVYRVQVLSNDFSGRQMQYYAPSEALSLIDEVEESYSTRNVSDIFSRIASTNSENSVEGSEIYLFSDFQELAFTPTRANIPQNELKVVLPSIKGPASNIAIDSAWFYEPVLQPGFDQTLKVKLSYSGDGVEDEVTLSLTINGEVQAVQKVSIKPESKTETEFTIRTQSPDNYTGTLKIDAGDDPDFDNLLHFNFQVAKPFRILLTGSNQNLVTYQKLFKDSIYQLDYTPESAIDYGRLSDYDLIIVDSPENFSSGFISAAKANLSEGKNLILIPSSENVEGINQLLSGLGKPALGTRNDGLKARSISWNDPHFSQVFNNTPQNPALPSCDFYYSYPSTAGYPLVKLENSKALVTRIPSSNGNIILFLSSLDSSGLKRQALIVPLVLNAVLFSRENQSLYSLAGKSNGPSFPKPKNAQVLAIELPDGNLIPKQRIKGNQVELFELSTSIAPGTYHVLDGSDIVGMVSLNTEPQESYWDFLTFDELNQIYKGIQPMVLEADGGSIEDLIRRQYQGVSLWKWFLFAAIFLLLLETFLLKIWK